jgi:hypothetical protein
MVGGLEKAVNAKVHPGKSSVANCDRSLVWASFRSPAFSEPVTKRRFANLLSMGLEISPQGETARRRVCTRNHGRQDRIDGEWDRNTAPTIDSRQGRADWS